MQKLEISYRIAKILNFLISKSRYIKVEKQENKAVECGLTANPAVNKLLYKLNHTRMLEGKPEISKTSINEPKDSAVLFSRQIPMQGLIHLSEGQGMSSEKIERLYKASLPSVFESISLSVQSFFRR